MDSRNNIISQLDRSDAQKVNKILSELTESPDGFHNLGDNSCGIKNDRKLTFSAGKYYGSFDQNEGVIVDTLTGKIYDSHSDEPYFSNVIRQSALSQAALLTMQAQRGAAHSGMFGNGLTPATNLSYQSGKTIT